MTMQELIKNLYFDKTLFSVGVLIVAFFMSTSIKRSIDLIFGRIKDRLSEGRMLSKTRTIRQVLKNIIEAILLSIAILIILARWDVNIGPLLASAGLIGLAFSFGAQTLVKDLISGFFIIIEDQFNIGDYIKVDKYEGEVYKMTLRLTILRDKKGNLVYIPNSQITAVTKITSN